MSIRFRSGALKSSVAIIGALSFSALLAGCTASSRFAAPLTTASINSATNADLTQAMPDAVAATQLPPSGQYLSASNSRARYIPGASIGSSNTQNTNARDPFNSGANSQVQVASTIGQNVAQQPQIVRQALPILTPNPVASTQSMPAMPSLAEVDLNTAPKIDQIATAGIVATPRAVPDNAFTHRIEAGESLYAIARRYDVTTDSIVAANGLASPDKIFVGQDVIIPGRPGTVAPKYAPTSPVAPSNSLKVAVATMPPASVPAGTLVPARLDEQAQVVPTPIARPANLAAAASNGTKTKQASTPVQQVKPLATQQVITTASVDPVEVAAPVVSTPKTATGSFRWPVKGRVIADFRASKNTGLNIEVPEGTSVRATENGEVIYVGSAVEGFGNLVLIKHSNGYVSAYAHLKDITVAKGAGVERGDSIGTAGMTGAVSRPQLHFELRKGATPVDPMLLLAS